MVLVVLLECIRVCPPAPFSAFVDGFTKVPRRSVGYLYRCVLWHAALYSRSLLVTIRPGSMDVPYISVCHDPWSGSFAVIGLFEGHQLCLAPPPAPLRLGLTKFSIVTR